MKVLVTGASGQLAMSLVERAERHGSIDLVLLGRPVLDLESPGGAGLAIAAEAPDLVINAAAYTAVDQAEDEPERAWRVNAEAAGEVATAAARCGAAVIHISTDYVFDGQADRPYVESDTPYPLGIYGKSKLAGEEQVRAANPDHLIVRTSWVFSPFCRNFVKSIVAAAERRDELTVVSDQHGCPTSALDLADALLAAAGTWRSAPRGETYHLAGTGSTSWFGFAQAIMEECRNLGLTSAEVRPIPSREWPTKAARPANSRLDSTKFAHDFGFTMPQWRPSLATVMQRLAAER